MVDRSSTIEIEGKVLPVYDFDQLKNSGEAFGFIYITENLCNHKYYVGLHYLWYKSYLGSGHYLKDDIKKYGKENFIRYIIDYRDNREELEKLEAYYIQEYFGFDCAESSDFYNITSGLQRGGDTWRGMSEEDRELRSERISIKGKQHRENMTEEEKQEESKAHHEAALKAFRTNPEYRKHISEGTKRGMTPEVRRHISEVQKGVPHPYKSEVTRNAARERMRKIGSISRTPWNKGKSRPEEERTKMREAHRHNYLVKRDGALVGTISVTNMLELGQKIGELFGRKTFGRNASRNLLKTGKPYAPVTPSKEVFRGITVERVGKENE